MIYLDEKGHYRGKSLCNPEGPMDLDERSDTSWGVYPRGSSMAVFAMHPEVIIQGQLTIIKTADINW